MRPVDDRFVNRELSWLAFNDRVLAARRRAGHPAARAGEVLRDLRRPTSTSSSRSASPRSKDQVAAGIDEPTPDGRTAAQQLAAIGERRAGSSSPRQEAVFLDRAAARARRRRASRSSPGTTSTSPSASDSTEIYEQRIFPVLTPLAVDPSHPFPYISNLALSIAAMVADPDDRRAPLRPGQGADRVPPPRRRSTATRFVPVEELITAQLHTLFVGHGRSRRRAAFRVTRNADLTLEDEDADDLLEAVEMELRRRRFNRAVRLEVAGRDERRDARAARARARARRRTTCTGIAAPLDLTLPVAAARRSTAPTSRTGRGRRSPPAGSPIAEETDRPLFSVIRDRAIMVHHPYESFASSDRGVHRAGRRRPAGAVDQDDAVPRRRRQPDHPQPDPGRRARRAGGRARRAEGPLRRGHQRQLGQGSSSAPASTSCTAWSG